jgi:RecB family exonuclease
VRFLGIPYRERQDDVIVAFFAGKTAARRTLRRTEVADWVSGSAQSPDSAVWSSREECAVPGEEMVMRHAIGILIAGTAAVGACTGDEPMRAETQLIKIKVE